MFSLAIFGGNKVLGSDLDPGERVVAVALFGGMELDFTSAPAPFVDVVVVALFGGAVVRVQPQRAVRLGGFSLFGGRQVEPRRLPPPRGAAASAASADADDDGDFPLEINAYVVFGGVTIKRASTLEQAAAVAH